MYFIFLVLFFCNPLFAHENSINNMFLEYDFSPQFKTKVPFLQKGVSQPEDDRYTLHFSPKEQVYESFSQIVGQNIFRSLFIVSWYVLTDRDEIPNSIDKMMTLVNTKKPIHLMPMTHINSQWESQVSMPYSEALRKDAHVVAYVSYPNANGVLVPIAGQVFHDSRRRTLELNVDILIHWKRKNYL